jgi:ankyrin repeat protein
VTKFSVQSIDDGLFCFAITLLIPLIMTPVEDLTSIIRTGNNSYLEKSLRENPSLVDCKTDQGISMLQYAAYCRNTGAVDLIKELVSQLDIFEAASVGDIQWLSTHLNTNPELLNSYSVDGFTPVGLACFFGQYDTVKFLISKGANISAASNNHFKVTPLHSACAVSHYKLAELLLENGADVNAKQLSGVTPLHSAAHHGQTKLASLLIEKGADVNAKMETGHTPLFMATEKGYTETAALISHHGGV